MPSTEQFGNALGDLARTWRSTMNERLKPLGLNHSTWVALRHISDNPQGLAQIELARLIGIEGPTLVKLVDKLEKDGLIVRDAHPQDRRIKRLKLTPKADPIVAKIQSEVAAVRHQMLEGIDAKELEQATALLKRIKQRLE